MFSKKEPAPKGTKATQDTAVDRVVQKSIDFESSRELLIRKSERRAWIVAACACGVIVVMAFALIRLFPLKEKVPYLITANPYTGASYLTRLPAHEDNVFLTTSEVFNKANLSTYVNARESYDWNLWSKRDELVIYAMSGADVRREYDTLYREPATNPDLIWGQNKVAKAYIKSIVLTGQDPKTKEYTGASVAFDRVTFDKSNGGRIKGESFICTVAFTYRSNLKMTEELRLQNPLGFQVTSYRLDPDLSSSSSSVMLKDAVGTQPQATVQPQLSVQ
jgi:type IV secretion system protein VirB8